MYKLADFHTFDEAFIRRAISEVFAEAKWVEAFLNEDHHGVKHGDQVRIGCNKLIGKFTDPEKEEFIEEGKAINKEHPFESAQAVTQLAAVFHDCGRFNDKGEVIGEEQKFHNVLSSKRAVQFCERIHEENAIPFIADATISHDYQNKKLTSHLDAPKTIIGKVVQASDQLGWFHPGSVHRTIEYSKAIGVEFLNKDLDIQKRIDWTPCVHDANDEDAITVLLHQLFGPTDAERFGIAAAQETIQKNKKLLKENILKESRARGCEKEVLELIELFQNR
jgi:HD superfamily phosphodiesterase